ncbi:MAG: hypothetical protein V1269_17735 [Deltaproteobacteria bacterium]|nr:hypothetical protein [Deltaproteobacteria bacterium]
MQNQRNIPGVELVDPIPLGTHKVIIDTYEERQFDEYTYLDFQLIGLEGEALDRQITHGVPYPKSGKATGKSKLGKLVQAAIPDAKGKIDFKHDLLQKTIMTEIIEEGPYTKVEKVWALEENPPAESDDAAETDDTAVKQTSSKADSDNKVPKV